MKRKVVLSGIVLAALFLCNACFLFEDDDDNDDNVLVTATQAVTWDYDSSFPIKELDSSVLSVTINNVPSGKTLYLIKRNTGSYALSSALTRGGSSSRSAVAENSVTNVDFSPDTTLLRKHFVGEKMPSVRGFSSARSALNSPSYATVEKTYTVGDKKNIYVDTDSGMSTFKQKSATLRAVGTNCYVWVVDDYYTTATTASGNKVNTAIAQHYAEKFDAMYPVITNVFGKESDVILDYDAKQQIAIASRSDTGSKINIVVYDIGADYNSSTQTGVVGYFYAKDYYYTESDLTKMMQPILGKSNVGKYFYIDSVYANTNFGDTISTLAHEFQHMVNFNQKDILQDVSPSTAYNEMLSMLCEDMMQNFLELQDYASPKNRILSFNGFYSLSGITEYLDENSALSYSTSYAFGSWLARQFGGAKLVQAMSTNSTVDTDSIVAAVNVVNGTSYSFDGIFMRFLLALTKNTTYTHNQDAAEELQYPKTGTATYTYPMKKFSLWSSASLKYDSDGDDKEDATYTFSLKGSEFEKNNEKAAYSGYTWTGPFVFSTDYAPKELRPENGISIHGVKTTSADTETITFAPQGPSTLKIYVIIQ